MEQRKINLNSIVGMDLRDYNTDQQRCKEIINLTKDKNGWRIRDDEHVVTNNVSYTQSVNAFITQSQTRAVVQIDRSIIIYSIEDDTLGILIDKFDFEYDFKLYKTNYLNVYFQIDETNHKSYILEFTDRLMTIIDDSGNQDLSTELLMNEYDASTGDFTWGGMARHADYTGNSKTWTEVNKYLIQYDSNNLEQDTEWHSIALLMQIDPATRDQRYVIVTGYGSDSYVYLFDWGDKTPFRWTTRLKLTGSNVFKIDGTGAVNSNARFMDIISKISKVLTYGSWNNNFGGGVLQSKTCQSLIKYLSDYYMITTEGICYINLGGIGSWIRINTPAFSNPSSDYLHITTDGTYIRGNDVKNIYVVSIETGQPDTIDTFTDESIYSFIDTSASSCYYYAAAPIPVYSQRIRALDKTSNVSSVITTTGLSAVSTSGPIGILYDDDTHLYCAKSDNVYKLTNRSGSWSAFGTRIDSNSVYCMTMEGSDYYIGTSNGVYKLTGGSGTWTTLGSGLTYKINDIKFNGTDIYVATESNGIWKLTGGSGAWEQFGTDLNSGSVDSLVIDGLNFRIARKSNGGTKQIAYSYVNDPSIIAFNVYIPNDDVVAQLKCDDGSTLVYDADYIPSGVTSAKSVKALDTTFTDGNAMSYLAIMCNNQVKVFIESVTGVRETANVNTFSVNSASLSASALEPFTYTNFVGMHVIQNRYYDEDITNSGYKGYTIVTCYNDNSETRFDTLELTVGNPTVNTVTMTRSAQGLSIPSSSPYYTGTTQYNITGVGVANIFPEGDRHNIYLTKDKKLYKYPLTGNSMTQDDINSIEEAYNSEISRYSDPDGNIITGRVSYTEGFVKTEINNSKKLPLRPYFTADSGDNVYANAVVTVTGDTQNILSQVYFIGATQTTTDRGRLYFDVVNNGVSNVRIVTCYSNISKITNVAVCNGFATIANGASAIVNLAQVNSSGINGCVKIYVATTLVNNTSTNNVLTIKKDPWELFNMYEMVKSDGRNFRTPVEVGEGSEMEMTSDDYQWHFKYWIFYMLWSGLYDDTIPYINLARGITNPINNNYDFKFWKQDPIFTQDVYNNFIGSENLPHRFSNITENYQDETTPVLQTYVLNDKLFFKWGDTYRDKFETTAFWQQNRNVLFEIQDLTFSAAELLMALDYENKSLYWSTGFKFINLLNRGQTLSKASAIQELTNNAGFIACENDLYYVSGTNEENIVLSYICPNVGLEKDNYKSLVTNGRHAFFYNKKCVWMVDKGTVVNLSPPIEDYIFRRTSGNVLGVDLPNNNLYIPLDYANMTALETILQENDYASTAQTIAYDKSYAVFDYNDLTYKIFSYQDDLTSGYNDFIGNFKDQIIVRTGTELVIPEYKEESGTENPICRIWNKRMAFGNVHSLKKLDTFMTFFQNNKNIDLAEYGIDYYKLYIIIDNKVIWKKKYGDFRSAATSYTDTTADYVIPNDAEDGWSNFKLPLGLDFHDIQIVVEFARLSDTNKSDSSISEIDIAIINKGSERNGII